MICAQCGATNEAGRKFCLECGTRLVVSCGVCGSPNTPGARFCGECGSPIAEAPAETAAAPAGEPAAPDAPTAERRMVSVLFADLVGFTTISESRDAEAVRDLLNGYFETCREIIGRYGGTVEKFIGDAVMAVWGTPVSREDDAERSVRAALELVDAASRLAEQVGVPELALRAGRPDRRGGGDPGRDRHGDGGRRHGQHRLATAVRRPARNGAGGGRHPPGGVGRHRLRARRRSHAQGQGRAGPRLPRPPGGRQARRRRARRAAGTSLRGPRRRAAADQGLLPRHRARARGPAGLGHGPGWESARAASPGSSTSTSTGSRKRSTGTRAAPRPTATG